MANFLNFKTIIEQDEDGIFVASCAAIPGCHSQGNTYEEAVMHIKEAIRLCLEVAKNDIQYKNSIDFGQKKTNRFIGISDIIIPKPSFVV